jgi:hypothetical protein
MSNPTWGQDINLLQQVSGSMGADITSRAHRMLDERGGHGSVTIEWSGGSTPIGPVYIRGSNNETDSEDVATAGTDWENIPGLVFNLSGNSGSQTFILEAVAFSYKWLDVFFDRTSGDGTMDRITLVVKE